MDHLEIAHAPGDDPAFLDGLARLVRDAVHRYEPADIFLVRTDNWFDVKWFAFAGNVREGTEPREVRHAWQGGSDVVIPPFVPNRITRQVHLVRADGVLMPAGEDARLVHPTEPKPSARNLRNRLLEHSSSGVYAWFSSRSQANGRASVMLYRTHDDTVDGWYASFIRGPAWRLDRVKNRDRAELEALFRTTAEG